MKILIIHNDYQIQGGETAVVNAEIDLLTRAGHDVRFYQRNNSEINRFGIPQKLSFFPNAIYSSFSYKEIRKIIKNEKPDIAHIHNVFPLISPSVYKALHDDHIPIVQTIHNVRFLCPNGLFYTHGKICERCKFGNTSYAVSLKCYRNSYTLSFLYAISIGLNRRWRVFNLIDRFIALTEFSKNKFIEAKLTEPHKISILGNYLHSPAPPPPCIDSRNSYIAYLGRLSEEKGIPTLIRAIALNNEIKLKVAGTGPDRENLQKLVRDLGSDQVKFVGHLTGNAKWDFLRNAMCTVVPSNWFETFPLVALESMAVGTPVIASNLGGLPYIIEDGKTGLLFAPGDHLDLANKISQLVNDLERTRMMGEECVKTINEKYTEEVHYRKLMEIYSQVLDEQRN